MPFPSGACPPDDVSKHVDYKTYLIFPGATRLPSPRSISPPYTEGVMSAETSTDTSRDFWEFYLRYESSEDENRAKNSIGDIDSILVFVCICCLPG